MHFEIFVDVLFQFRWRLFDEHSRVIAVAADGFYNKTACERNIELVRTAGTAEVRDLSADNPHY